MPFTLKNLRQDVADVASNFDGPPGLEFRHASKALGLERSGLTFHRIPPGTWRGYEAGPEGLELLILGAPHLGDNPQEDVQGRRDWWSG